MFLHLIHSSIRNELNFKLQIEIFEIPMNQKYIQFSDTTNQTIQYLN